MLEEGGKSDVKVGDLVVYTHPRQYLTAGQGVPFGLVVTIESFFARVIWSDGEVYLESMIDLKAINN